MKKRVQILMSPLNWACEGEGIARACLEFELGEDIVGCALKTAEPTAVTNSYCIGMEQFWVEICRVGHFHRYAHKPRLLELAACGACRLTDSESAAIIVHRQVESNQRLPLMRSTVEATLGSGST